MNAGTDMPLGDGPLSPASFGVWLRQLREVKALLLRQLAAAAEMDPSHLGKVERGERPPTREQALAFARCLGVEEKEMATRYAAMRLYEVCGGDAALVHAVGGFAQEEAAPYLVSNPASNRAKKK